MSDACLETIADNIHELEKQKSSLERRLDEVRQRPLCLEDTHSVWQLYLSESSQERARSIQDLHLAQNALSQSHTKLNTLRELFERKNEWVRSLHKQIEEEKAEQKKTAGDRESILESVCKNLKDLKSQNGQDHLKSQILNMDEQIHRLQIETSSVTNRTQELNQKLDQLTAGNAAEDGAEGWGDLEMIRKDQQLIQSLLHEDQLRMKERVCNITLQLSNLETEADQLEA